MVIVGFKKRAKQLQIKFREDVLKVGYDGFKTILKDEDAQKGLIFFDGFKINEYAPEPEKTLMDKTSFDVFIEYRQV